MLVINNECNRCSICKHFDFWFGACMHPVLVTKPPMSEEDFVRKYNFGNCNGTTELVQLNSRNGICDLFESGCK